MAKMPNFSYIHNVLLEGCLNVGYVLDLNVQVVFKSNAPRVNRKHNWTAMTVMVTFPNLLRARLRRVTVGSGQPLVD